MNLAANNDANGVTLVAAEAHVRIIPSSIIRAPRIRRRASAARIRA
jgi:hypothetical protein